MIVKMSKGFDIPLRIIKGLLRLLMSKNASKGLSEVIDAVSNTQGQAEPSKGKERHSRGSKEEERHYKGADYPHGQRPPSKLPKQPPPPREGPRDEKNPNSSND